LDDYFKETYKSTKEIIENNNIFFQNLIKIKEIYILGHSLSNVDLPYYEKIINMIDKKKVVWKISVFDSEDLTHHKYVIQKFGIDDSLIEFDLIENLNTMQLSLFKNEKL
jgi:hypothetical protein